MAPRTCRPVAFSPHRPYVQRVEKLPAPWGKDQPCRCRFLPPLLFEAALSIPWRELRRDYFPITVLATLGTMCDHPTNRARQPELSRGNRNNDCNSGQRHSLP